MRKLIFFLLLLPLMVGCSLGTTSKDKQQNKPLPSFVSLSGRQDVLMRFTPEAKYLLLPIQESATEGRMRVLIGQHEVDNFVIRLAVDSIDYYVPYAWPTDTGTVLLDMCFWDKEVDRTACVCWDSIYQSDEFDTTNREPMRPEYHHTPLYGWMNDPNGMFYDDQTGLWHLYFQYNPYGSLWQNMTWGHSTSPDLIHWTHHPEAIRPNALGTIFSGSCVVDRNNSAGFGENAVIAIYTNSEMCGQSQSIAYSLDGGMTFTPYEGNPVLADSLPDFRDPKVFWDEQANCWTMALACQQEIRFFQSPDLKNWTFVSRFGKGYGCHDGVWECPDLIRLDNHYVLLVNINPGGPFGGSATQYFVGDWDGKEFIVESQKSKEESKWLDYGKDHYATVTFHNAPDSRVTALAWVSNWEYANKLPMTQYRSQNSLPRELSLFQDDQGEYRVAVMPSPEALALKGNQIDAPTDECMIEITCPCENKKTVITLSNDKGEKVVMKLDLCKKTFSMDRKQSGDCSFSRDFAAVTTAPLFKMANANANANAVTLFIDHCVLEAFDGEGAWAMTNLVFPSAPYNHIHVVGGEATIYEIDRLR